MRHVVYDVMDAITWTCWGVLGVTWAAGALSSRARSLPARERSGHDLASALGAIAGAAVVVSPASLWHSIIVDSVWLRIAGGALALLATGATVWARITLGTTWSSGVVAPERHQLRTDGPYRITRHPIYTGFLTMLFATTLTQGLGRWVAVLPAVLIVLVAKMRAEERLLAREFPDDYRRYKQRVPALLPRLVPRGR
jgi:protein-S-isoprenylcysteine O-methyltransferase Ste14